MIRNRFLFFFLVFCAFTAIGVGALGGLIHHIGQQKSSADASESLYFKSGQGMVRASYLAYNAGAVKAPWHFQLIASIKGVSRRLQAGEYALEPSLTLAALVDRMASGQVMTRTLVVPEGFSNLQILDMMEKSATLNMDGIMLGAEGSYAPDSYSYHRGEQASALLKRMADKQQAILLALWQQRPENFYLESMDQVLTLASIIEKETAIPCERSIIAAVFINRLKKGMRLQSDPTIIYGLTGGRKLDRPLSRRDIREKTAYNTYRINGLPPGPIANPGEDAIRAVFEPAMVDYLYFVADGTGGHIFAKRYKDHLENVRRWRKIEASGK